MPTYEELFALATEVATWIPEKKGDRIAGKVVEVGTITTKFGEYHYTNILQVFKEGDEATTSQTETRDGG